MKHLVYGLCLLTFLIPVVFAQAQTPCGNIIFPANPSDPDSEEYVTPIENCENPFEKTHPLTTFTINNSAVEEGSSFAIGASGLTTYGFEGDNFFGYEGTYYRHQGADYVQTATDFEEPSHDVIVAEITAFFNNQPNQILKYTQIYFAVDRYPYFVSENDEVYFDPIAQKYVSEVFEELEVYVQEHVQSPRVALMPGTYTVVRIDTDEGPSESFNTDNPLQKLFAHLVPTAYAYYNVHTVTFTLEEEPTGASSVLFLPGIQASRLYLGDGYEVSNRLWEPSNNDDVRALALSEQGTSIVDIRTEDIIDEAAIPVVGKNIYKGFINFMNELVSDEVIAEWTPFAYDWRYDVFDIVENGTKYRDGSIHNPVDELISLAEDSLSDRVTIVAHSNGGLLAKAIMIELENRGQGDLVDKIVFIGTPHLGTPMAIGTLLHGYDQEKLGGLIIDDGVARDVIRNLPGGYGLLPSERYLEITSEPVVYFDNSQTTAHFRDVYGTTISDISELTEFLNGTENVAGRENVTIAEVNKPIKANTAMLSMALQNHKNKLDSWMPPSGVEVFQIAGTGLPTVKAIEYRGIEETVCPPGVLFYLQCTKTEILKPHVQFTAYGDKTVASKSAAHGSNSVGEVLFLDLNKIEEERIPIIGTKFEHSNLTENIQVQELLDQIYRESMIEESEYLVYSEPHFDKNYDIEAIDSPVRIFAIDTEGRVTGIIEENGSLVKKEEIPDSTYFEFGGTKYLLIPSETERSTNLVGEELGGYTLTISSLDSSDIQSIQHMVVNASTSPSMFATFTKDSGSYTNISTDIDGDGVYDYESTIDGEPIIESPTYTYEILLDYIKNLELKKVHKNLLLSLVKEAQKFNNKSDSSVLFERLEKLSLGVLKATVVLYERKKLLTSSQAEELIKVIEYLSK